jgi:hypothetical protein
MTKHRFTDQEGNGITVEAENKETSIAILERLGINPESLEYCQLLNSSL